MATLITEPKSFVKGDTVTWQITLDDYPAPTWVLAYHFAIAGSRISVTAAAQADGSHLVAISAATSATFAAGMWTWQQQVTSETVRHTVGTGQIQVVADYATAGASVGVDARTHNEKAVAALEAVIEKRATHDDLEYTVNTPQGGRSVKLLSHEQLINALKFYRAELARERRLASAAKYGASKILVRIGRT